MKIPHLNKAKLTQTLFKSGLAALGICTAVILLAGILKYAATSEKQTVDTEFQSFEPITQTIEQIVQRGMR